MITVDRLRMSYDVLKVDNKFKRLLGLILELDNHHIVRDAKGAVFPSSPEVQIIVTAIVQEAIKVFYSSNNVVKKTLLPSDISLFTIRSGMSCCVGMVHTYPSTCLKTPFGNIIFKPI